MRARKSFRLKRADFFVWSLAAAVIGDEIPDLFLPHSVSFYQLNFRVNPEFGLPIFTLDIEIVYHNWTRPLNSTWYITPPGDTPSWCLPGSGKGLLQNLQELAYPNGEY
jgi:hypothetical protein